MAVVVVMGMAAVVVITVEEEAVNTKGHQGLVQEPLTRFGPEPFLEALAAQVALDASRLVGRLVAAQALANVFQTSARFEFFSCYNQNWEEEEEEEEEEHFLFAVES
ncbi:hypothetical protein OIU74_008238 [Salix koriyanagi]|uniref:Uncharacterized protein n=1 Tax=Salix koriyanagi TaxID=2511006 RepID=A0A9Q0Z717_9ROSI|nr:hypothetical protein OIU74_008238 [Salix koriyanagi]